MNHLKWDSDIIQEYIANLQRMSRSLETEIQRLSVIKRKIENENADGEDEVLAKVCAKLYAMISRLREENERILRLCTAMNKSIEAFDTVEKKISGFELDMLYRSVERHAGTQGPSHSPVTVYSSAFSRNDVIPEWLRALVSEEQLAI